MVLFLDKGLRVSFDSLVSYAHAFQYSRNAHWTGARNYDHDIITMSMSGVQTQSREIVGIVLGGGRGTRLHPLTAETSKHLLPIGKKPMIVRTIEQLLAAGVKDILLLIDQRYASQYMQTLQDGSHLGASSLAYIWQPPEGKGLPSAIHQAAPHVLGRKIVVACGDVLIEAGIKEPINNFIQQSSGAHLVSAYVNNSAGYSLLEVEGDRVVNIRDKNKARHDAGFIDLGIYMYHPDVFDCIEDLAFSPRGETEIWDLNMKYAKDRNLSYTVVGGWWSDAGGSIQTYLEAHQHYAE